MSTYKVTREPHYDADATVAVHAVSLPKQSSKHPPQIEI